MNQTTILVIVLVIVVVAIVLIFMALRLRGSKKSNLKERLDSFTNTNVAETVKDEAQLEGGASATRALVAERIDKVLKGRNFADNIARNLARADLKITVGEFLLFKVASTGAGVLLGWYLGRGFGVFALIVGLLVGILGLYIPDMYVKRRSKKRMKTFNNQLGDTITLMANSLRSGYSLLQSMDLIAREAPAPMADEYKRVTREVGLGLSSREALANMLRRVPSDDLDLLITAINIQSEVGGNLSQILDNIGHTIRERVRIKGEITVLTAQQQYSGYILSGLPLALAGVLMLINSDYITRMFKWPWLCMPICGIIMIIAGFFAIKKITDIEV
ncbi:type II secretion system F family protein [Candidatus Chlorohelix sp.]|uniref:type II secretion system F family protein n=1 Tax=Candidatus Chlorohelix sp. TaxID=3139201 RepID=UPI0030292BCE